MTEIEVVPLGSEPAQDAPLPQAPSSDVALLPTDAAPDTLLQDTAQETVRGRGRPKGAKDAKPRQRKRKVEESAPAPAPTPEAMEPLEAMPEPPAPVLFATKPPEPRIVYREPTPEEAMRIALMHIHKGLQHPRQSQSEYDKLVAHMFR